LPDRAETLLLRILELQAENDPGQVADFFAEAGAPLDWLGQDLRRLEAERIPIDLAFDQ